MIVHITFSTQVSWTRWHITSFPYYRFLTKIKFDGATLMENVIMVEPVLIPLNPIDLHALHIEAIFGKPIRRNSQGLISTNRHVDIAKPRRLEKVYWLCHNWVETQHLPDQPRIQGPSI